MKISEYDALLERIGTAHCNKVVTSTEIQEMKRKLLFELLNSKVDSSRGEEVVVQREHAHPARREREPPAYIKTAPSDDSTEFEMEKRPRKTYTDTYDVEVSSGSV